MNSGTHMSLKSHKQIAAYLHRTRMDILDVLGSSPATITQIASKLGVHPANLTRHVRRLVEAGLIELDHTRDTGRNLEKYYRSVADTFDVSPEAEDLEAPHKVALDFARSDLSAAIAQLPDTIEHPVLTLVAAARIQHEDLAEFCSRLESLVKDFEGSDSKGGVEYHINLNLYPGRWKAADGSMSIRRKENST